MSLPQTLNPASPADADSPSQGASAIRGLKQYLIDVLGVPNNSAVTAAGSSVSTAGVMTILQSPFTVPTLMQGGPSTLLRISSQYTNIGFEVNGATIMALGATGLLMQKPFVEWASGVTGFLGTQGAQALQFRTSATEQVYIGGMTGVLSVVGNAAPSILVKPNSANNAQIWMQHGSVSTNSKLVSDSSGNLFIYTADTSRIQLDNAGNIRMAGQLRCDLDTSGRLVVPVGTNKYAT